MNHKILFPIFFISLIIFSSCKVQLEDNYDFAIVSFNKTQGMFSKPTITFQVKNKSQRRNSCTANIRFMRNDTELEKTFALFLNMEPNEIEQEITNTFRIGSHNDYTRVEIELEWDDPNFQKHVRLYKF